MSGGRGVSAAMCQVLEACATATDGTVSVAQVVALRLERGERQTTARSSVSRTLRRLRRLGLVELATNWGVHLTMTGRAEDIRAIAEDPDGYAAYCQFRAAIGRPPDMTEHEYYAHQRARVDRPKLRVRQVILTEAGREWFSVNSHSGVIVNPTPRRKAASD